MHRVELKDISPPVHKGAYDKVPNAPCGVESRFLAVLLSPAACLFLMHRVELKGEKIWILPV